MCNTIVVKLEQFFHAENLITFNQFSFLVYGHLGPYKNDQKTVNVWNQILDLKQIKANKKLPEVPHTFENDFA